MPEKGALAVEVVPFADEVGPRLAGGACGAAGGAAGGDETAASMEATEASTSGSPMFERRRQGQIFPFAAHPLAHR
jgi:hypothetical protein